MLKISFEFEMSGDGKRRADDQRVPAPFVISAVVAYLPADIGIELEASDGKSSFDGQSVAIPPGCGSFDGSDLHAVSIR
jgi:hypothetical protein